MKKCNSVHFFSTFFLLFDTEATSLIPCHCYIYFRLCSGCSELNCETISFFKSGAFLSVLHCQSPHHWPELPANHSPSCPRAGGTSSLTCRYPTNGRACLPCPRREVRSCTGERNRCLKIRAAIQPGRKPRSHCIPRLNQQATAQPQMEIL